MNTVPGVFYIRRRSSGSTVEPQVFEVEYGEDTKTEPTVTTMADSVRPLLTSMKLFGLYFKFATEAEDKMANEKSRRRWNGHLIYGLFVDILLWINVVRMFSVFKNILRSCTYFCNVDLFVFCVCYSDIFVKFLILGRLFV